MSLDIYFFPPVPQHHQTVTFQKTQSHYHHLVIINFKAPCVNCLQGGVTPIPHKSKVQIAHVVPSTSTGQRRVHFLDGPRCSRVKENKNVKMY